MAAKWRTLHWMCDTCVVVSRSPYVDLLAFGRAVCDFSFDRLRPVPEKYRDAHPLPADERSGADSLLGGAEPRDRAEWRMANWGSWAAGEAMQLAGLPGPLVYRVTTPDRSPDKLLEYVTERQFGNVTELHAIWVHYYQRDAAHDLYRGGHKASTERPHLHYPGGLDAWQLEQLAALGFPTPAIEGGEEEGS